MIYVAVIVAWCALSVLCLVPMALLCRAGSVQDVMSLVGADVTPQSTG